MSLLDSPFDTNRHWLDYRHILMDKFEDIVIFVSDNLERIKAIEDHRKDIILKAFENKFIRVYVAMIDDEIKLIDIFKLFLKNTSVVNSSYLFAWIRK